MRQAGINGALSSVQDAGKQIQEWKQALLEAVAEARKQGATWEQIGEALGVSAQAANRRFGPRSKRAR